MALAGDIIDWLIKSDKVASRCVNNNYRTEEREREKKRDWEGERRELENQRERERARETV